MRRRADHHDDVCPPALTTHAYGREPDQVADLWLPGDGPAAQHRYAVVVLLHGGFWRERYRRDLMAPLAVDLAARGYAAWNVEYRRVGGHGGWPATLEDVAAAIDHLASLDAVLDPARVAVVGHSAGGHLALWAAGRACLPAGAPGARPLVRPAAVVGQAPVADLRAADAAGLSAQAVRELLGGDEHEVPVRWAVADPIRLVGHGTRTLLVHADDDADVPPALSIAYREAAGRAGDPVELRRVGGGHDAHLDPSAPAWRVAVAWLAGELPPGRGP